MTVRPITDSSLVERAALSSYGPAVSDSTTGGQVFLLGAGPGDPELVTVRARRRLEEADVVLYDALVHPELLEHCRENAELVFVGKRAGKPSERQSRINDRLIAEARAGKKVARLKGGDPYLFGRGTEEAEVLAAAGIRFEVVPGVPSPLAATAYAGLSLTHRDLASSVAYLTATESPQKDRSSHDWAKLANGPQTLVIFMGMRKLDTLMTLLTENGRPPETPVAVVQWASLPRQKTIVGTVADIAEKAEGLGLPSLIIVGEVVRLRDKLRFFDSRPLFGKTVLVPRAPRRARDTIVRLRDASAQPLAIATFTIEPPADRGALRAAIDAGGHDWVLFTSAPAVTAFGRAMGDRDARVLGSAKVAAVGAKTAQALRSIGIHADLVSPVAHAEGLLDALGDAVGTRSRFLFPRAGDGRETLVEGLEDAGHEVTLVTAYDKQPVSGEALDRLSAGIEEADAILVTSGSVVRSLVEAAGTDALKGKVLASIGPVTSEALRDAGLEPTFEATDASLDALVDALETHYAGQG